MIWGKQFGIIRIESNFILHCQLLLIWLISHYTNISPHILNAKSNHWFLSQLACFPPIVLFKKRINSFNILQIISQWMTCVGKKYAFYLFLTSWSCKCQPFPSPSFKFIGLICDGISGCGLPAGMAPE
jgi:hypothetical protein